jgi:hypothetical protein
VNIHELPRDAAGKTFEDYYAELSAADARPDTRFRVMSAAEFLADDSIPEDTSGANDMIVEHITPRPRFTPIPADQFADGKPLPWLIKGVLPQAELVVMYGASGSGKSFLALDMAAALTRGIDWNGNEVARACKAAYVAAEAAGGFKKRMRAYAKQNGVPLSVLPWVIPDCPNFLSVKDPAAVIEGSNTTGPYDVVILDTLSAITPGMSENDSADMGKIIEYCKLVHRKTGALVIVITHSGKDASRGARGHSSLKAAADAEIEVVRDGRTDKRHFSITKQKDSEDGGVTPFRLPVVSLEDGESSCVVSFDIPKGERTSAAGYKPKGYERNVMSMIASEHAEDFDIKELTQAVHATLPKIEGRDQRARSIGKAITTLCRESVLEVVPDSQEERVRTRGPRSISEQTWLEGAN